MFEPCSWHSAQNPSETPQTGVTLKHMLDFGANPIHRQLLLSAQFLHNELPVRLAHRVAELENLPYGLSAKPHVLKVSLVHKAVYVGISSLLSGVLAGSAVKDCNLESSLCLPCPKYDKAG